MINKGYRISLSDFSLKLWYFRSNSSFDRIISCFDRVVRIIIEVCTKHARVEEVCVVVKAYSIMQLYKLAC